MVDEYFLMPQDIRICGKEYSGKLNKSFIKLTNNLKFSNINILKRSNRNSLKIIEKIDIETLKKNVEYLDFPNLEKRFNKICSKPFFSKRLPKKDPIIMGILNVTRDSFYDGGRFYDKEKAISQAYKLLEEGADIIDLGAESTRPGAIAITPEEEIRRLIPIASHLSKDNILLSCDTRNSSTMSAVLDVGVNIINDISGLNHDKNSLKILKEYNCLYVLTHSKGDPEVMQNNPFYDNVICDVHDFFEKKLNHFLKHNFPLSNVIIDPGIGFGKKDIHNFDILKFLAIYLDFGLPILIGLSRKSLIGRFIKDTPANSLNCSIALAIDAYLKGASLLRVHDVKETLNALNIIKHVNA